MSDLHDVSDTVRVSLRVPRATVELWDERRGFESLSSWLRRAGDAFAEPRVRLEDGVGRVVSDRSVAAAVAAEIATVKADPKPAARSSANRTGMCEHRVPAGSYCKRCGSV